MRKLLPAEQVTATYDVYPDECEECGLALPQEADARAPEPRRHQVVEVPEIRPDVFEWRLHAKECDGCGHCTRARLPPGVPTGMFGPRFLATLALLTGDYHLTRRRVVQLFADLFGIDVSLGAVSEAEDRVSEIIAPAVDEAVQFARSQPIKHFDATGWLQRNASRTLWTIATALVTVFAITEDATMPAVRAVLGRVYGFLISDRATQFGFWAMRRRQICWAHLLRKFAAFEQIGGEAGRIGRHLREYGELLFHYWHRVRDGTLSRAEFVRDYLPSIQPEVERLLERGAHLRVPRFSGACANILEHRQALWTFAHQPGIAPTNNHAERELRGFVLWRKQSFGSQSDRGTRFAVRIMSVVHTLRKQRRHVLSYLYEACANALHHRPPPSLLPLNR